MNNQAKTTADVDCMQPVGASIGKIVLKDFYKVLDIDEVDFEAHKGEAETLAGFILEISGKFPKKQEELKFKGFTFKIEALDKKRIKQIKVTIPNG